MTERIIYKQHTDVIHDAQFDYYGKRLATCSSDQHVHVYNVDGDNLICTSVIHAHSSPVLRVCWSSPKYNNLLASCSVDGSVCIWKEEQSRFVKVFETSFDCSVNSLAFSTFDFCLLAGCSDGQVNFITHKDNTWSTSSLLTHKGGVFAVCWIPLSTKFLTAGADCNVRLWEYQGLKCIDVLPKVHSSWIRDLDCHQQYVATCSDDKSVVIWVSTDKSSYIVAKQLKFDTNVYRVSWSTMGLVLAVSHEDNQVSLWKETGGDWKQV